jgi:hypothetical protein
VAIRPSDPCPLVVKLLVEDGTDGGAAALGHGPHARAPEKIRPDQFLPEANCSRSAAMN